MISYKSFYKPTIIVACMAFGAFVRHDYLINYNGNPLDHHYDWPQATISLPDPKNIISVQISTTHTVRMPDVHDNIIVDKVIEEFRKKRLVTAISRHDAVAQLYDMRLTQAKLLTDTIVKIQNSIRKSLFTEAPPQKNPLTYWVDEEGQIDDSTDAHYYEVKPMMRGSNPEFDMVLPTNFGLRAYYFSSKDGRITDQWGEARSNYYSAGYDKTRGIFALTAPGIFRIDLIDAKSRTLLKRLENYAAITLTFHQGKLYFSGGYKDTPWDQTSIYEYDPATDKITNVFFDRQLADCRGIAFYKNSLIATDGFHNKVRMLNLDTHEETIFEGFHYPNGVTVNKETGAMLVADEHHHLVRKIDLKTYREIWDSPQGQLKSPGYAIEVPRGKYKGYMLIADTDNNRVILVEPKSWTIVTEITNLRSVLKVRAVFDPVNG